MISLIIINYNGALLIADCLHALENQTFQDFQTIIIENGSTDNSLKLINVFLRESSIRFRTNVIVLHKNRGFAGGNLEGLKYASGEFIALLNNDTEPHKDCLQELYNAMLLDSKTGICASKLISCGDNTIDSAGDGYARSLKGFKRGEGESPTKFDEKTYVFGACAGAALYRREMLNRIGFFDDDFFLIHEDTDLNLRAQLAGWKVMYVPTAIVHHKVRSSIGKMSELAAYYSLRNSELVRFKNIPFEVFLLCLPQFLVGVISEFIYFVIKHRFFRIYLKAKFDALKLLPKMLRKRKEIFKKRKVSNKYILEIMTPLLEKNFIKSKIQKLLYD
jgi:GT2 family glycosyltransferase